MTLDVYFVLTPRFLMLDLAGPARSSKCSFGTKTKTTRILPIRSGWHGYGG